MSRRKRAPTDNPNESQGDDREPPEHGQRIITGRLLLVEDHPDLAAYLAERLSEYMPVTCVGSAECALEVLTTDPAIGLVLSDVVLPGASGLELCRYLAGTAEDDRVPVILISAKATTDDRDAGLAAGAVAYLTKPFIFESLLAAMASAWPAVAARFSTGSTDPDNCDPVLAIALGRLDDATFGISDWATEAELSERQLRRRVNELSGQLPQVWLREQRLLQVRRLLRNGTCRTMAEAGLRAGMDNLAYLYRSYRARFGEH